MRRVCTEDTYTGGSLYTLALLYSFIRDVNVEANLISQICSHRTNSQVSAIAMITTWYYYLYSCKRYSSFLVNPRFLRVFSTPSASPCCKFKAAAHTRKLHSQAQIGILGVSTVQSTKAEVVVQENNLNVLLNSAFDANSILSYRAKPVSYRPV